MLMLVCETQTHPYTVEIGAGNPNLALVNGVPIYNTHVLSPICCFLASKKHVVQLKLM